MPTKYIIIAVVIVFLLVIAAYARIINIDAVLRKHDKPSYPANIIVCDLSQHFNYGSNGGFIINNKPLRVYSSCLPPVVIRLSVSEDGKHIFVYDSSGKEFLLGNIVGIRDKDHSSLYTIGFEAKDKIIFRSSYSYLPYYHGLYIISPGPISRYYHYYSFRIEKESGASMLLEWKFSTYKGADGKLVPDLFGDNQEGLIKVSLINIK